MSSGPSVARGLAWFGIGLGLVELLAPRWFGRAIGLEDRADLISAYGLREIGAGALVLAAEDPQAALWARVVGDGMDGAALASGLTSANPRRTRTLLATLAVSPIVILDVLYARKSR